MSRVPLAAAEQRGRTCGCVPLQHEGRLVVDGHGGHHGRDASDGLEGELVVTAKRWMDRSGVYAVEQLDPAPQGSQTRV